jgi:hypothetical protein
MNPALQRANRASGRAGYLFIAALFERNQANCLPLFARQVLQATGCGKDIDDAAVVDTLLDQIANPITSFTADGAYDQDQVSQAVAEHHPDAAIIVPPRAGAVASASSETAPTQRDRHLRMIAERGRMAWQKASGYNLRAKVEASIGRYKRVIGDALRCALTRPRRPRLPSLPQP